MRSMIGWMLLAMMVALVIAAFVTWRSIARARTGEARAVQALVPTPVTPPTAPDDPVAGAVDMDGEIDAFLAPHADALGASRRLVVGLRLDEMAIDDPRASKVGGRPYWADGRDYPLGADGAPLHLLAQIDFATLPPGMRGYPERGLLQMFIAASDHYGANFDDGMSVEAMSVQRDFRVVYWPDTAAPARDIAPAVHGALLPHDPARPRRMHLESRSRESIGARDHRFARLFDGDVHGAAERHAAARGLDAEALLDAMSQRYTRDGHKIGGHPTFTQDDPRNDDRMQLLLQLDSDAAMMWGDAGVAGVFIAPEDLARADFSRVLYTWDCY